MGKSLSSLCLGVFILILALFMWRTTGSFAGWLVLFLPGSLYVFRGLCLVALE